MQKVIAQTVTNLPGITATFIFNENSTGKFIIQFPRLTSANK